MSTQTKSKNINKAQFLEQRVLSHTNKNKKVRVKQFVKYNV